MKNHGQHYSDCRLKCSYLYISCLQRDYGESRNRLVAALKMFLWLLVFKMVL